MELQVLKLKKYIKNVKNSNKPKHYKYKILKKISWLKNYFLINKSVLDASSEDFKFLNEFYNNFENFKNSIKESINKNEDDITIQEYNYVKISQKTKFLMEINNIKNTNFIVYKLTSSAKNKLNIIEKKYNKLDKIINKSKEQWIDTYILKTKIRTNKIKILIVSTSALIGGIISLGSPIGVSLGSGIGYTIGSYFGKKIDKKCKINIKLLQN